LTTTVCVLDVPGGYADVPAKTAYILCVPTPRRKPIAAVQAAIQRFRPAVEDIAQQDLGYRLAYPGARVNDGVFQTNLQLHRIHLRSGQR